MDSLSNLDKQLHHFHHFLGVGLNFIPIIYSIVNFNYMKVFVKFLLIGCYYILN